LERGSTPLFYFLPAALQTTKRKHENNGIKMTNTTHQDSNQQFHDLHTLDIGRHAADKGNSSLLKDSLKEKVKLAFDPNRRYRKMKRKKKKKSEEEKNG
jgi:hypothetical protein